jgi:hypothetical protein
MQAAKHEAAPLTAEQLDALLERLASAKSIADVNIAAGIALNEILDLDE